MKYDIWAVRPIGVISYLYVKLCRRAMFTLKYLSLKSFFFSIFTFYIKWKKTKQKRPHWWNNSKIKYQNRRKSLPYLGLHNAHWCIMRTPSWPWKSPEKKLVRVYNAHGLLKKIVVRNVRIKYQSYIFFSPLSMFHLLGEFKNHLSLFFFNKVAKY
jgi:hypothetical protein